MNSNDNSGVRVEPPPLTFQREWACGRLGNPLPTMSAEDSLCLAKRGRFQRRLTLGIITVSRCCGFG